MPPLSTPTMSIAVVKVDGTSAAETDATLTCTNFAGLMVPAHTPATKATTRHPVTNPMLLLPSLWVVAPTVAIGSNHDNLGWQQAIAVIL